MISKTAEYALRAVATMATTPDQPVSADILAKKTQVPRRYLTRVLQELASAGMVRSRSGPGGGYVLISDLDNTTILDVINVVAPIQRIRECPLKLEGHQTLCPLHAQLDCSYAATESAFASVTLRQLIESTGEAGPLCKAP